MKKLILALSVTLGMTVNAQVFFKGENGKYGLKDKGGNVIVQPKYTYTREFHQGLAVVNIGAVIDYKKYDYPFGGKWGYIDETGQEIIPLKYPYAEDFKEDGTAKVGTGNKKGRVNKKGKEVIPLIYHNAWQFSEGLAAVALGNSDKWGFVDETGKVVIPIIYSGVHPFQHGLARVNLNDNVRDTYINLEGVVVISAEKYDAMNGGFPNINGLTWVGKNGKYGFIDHTGKEITPLKYESVGNCADERCMIKLNGKYGFVDLLGQEIIAPIYDEILRNNNYDIGFYNEKAEVTQNGRTYYIDKNGNEIK